MTEQLQKSTWHPSNFGKTRKIVLQQFWQTNLAKIETWQNSPPRAYMHARIVLPSAFPSRWEGEKRNKE
jgi:hypothetical protein